MIYDAIKLYKHDAISRDELLGICAVMPIDADDDIPPYENEDPSGTFADLASAAYAFKLSPEEYEEIRSALERSR